MANKRPKLDIGSTTKDSTVKNNLLCEGTINVTAEGASNVTIGDLVENVDSKNTTFKTNINYSTSGKNNEEDAVPSTSDGRGAMFAGPTNIGSTIHHTIAENVHSETTVIFNNGTHTSSDTIVFQVKEPETSFTGRSNELHRLHKFFSVIVKVIGVVYGMGGVGKTQLVREFIKRNRDLYNNFIWIHSDEVTSIDQSFAKLSKELSLRLKDDDGDRMESESVIARVLERLCKRKTLFVYDNVDNPESTDYLKSILGRALTVDANNLHVLITSQHQEWPLEFERFSLNVWDKTESVEYISTILDGCGNDTVDDKGSLADTLQYFPLALRQATAYISVQRRRPGSKFKISEFIGIFNRRTGEMLKDEKFKKQMISVYERTTYTAWSIVRNEIKKDEVNGELAMRILNIIAFCGPDRIRRDIFYYVGNGQINQIIDEESEEFEDWKEAVDSAVDLLTTYCMVNRVEEEDSEDIHLSIHQLVQKVTRLLLEESNEVETSLRDALQLFTNLAGTEQVYHLHDFEFVRWIFNFVISSSVREILIKDFLSRPNIIDRYCSALRSEFDFFRPMFEILGPGNRHALKIEYYIALNNIDDDDDDDYYDYYDFALDNLLDIFEEQKVHLSEVDPDTLGTQCQILSSYVKHGKHKKAISLLKHNTCLGDIFDDVISTFEKYKINCRLTLPLYQSILRVQKRILGEGHYDTIPTLTKIVNAQREQGNSELSFKYFKELLEVECRVIRDFQDYYPCTLRMYLYILTQTRTLKRFTNLHLLACEHHELENYNASARLFEIVLEVRTENYGDDWEIMFRISCAHHHLTNFDASAAWYQKAVGEVNFNIEGLEIILDQVRMEREGENYDLALCWYNIILKKTIALLGESHPTTVEIMYEIASTYIDLKVTDSASDWYQKAIDIHRKSLREGCSYTEKTVYRIARTHGKFKSIDKALDQYRNALDQIVYEIINGNFSGWSTKIFDEVNFHCNKENYELALGLAEIIFEKVKNVPFYYLFIQNAVAERHPADALKLFQFVLEKQKESLGASHCDTLKTMRRIADVHFKLKDCQCALRMYEDLLEKHKVVSSDDAVEIQCLIARTHACLASDNAALEMYRNILDKLIERAKSIDEIDWGIIENEVKFHLHDSYNLALGLYNIIFEEKKKNLDVDHYRLQTILTEGSSNALEHNELQRQTENLVEMQQKNDDALALSIYGNKLEIAIKFLADDTDVWKKFYDEASFQFDEHNYELALRFYELLLEKQMFWFGKDYSCTLKTMHEIARIHAKLKRYDQALSTYQVVLDTRKTSLGDFHPDTLETMSQLAHLHKELGHHSDAIQLYRQVYAILNYLKGSEHPDALSAFQLGELEERDVSMDYLPDSLKEEFEFTERLRKQRATK